MGVFLAGAFFTDKVRSAITMFLLTLILGLFAFQYFFPRHPPTLDSETLTALQDVRGTLEKVASNLEKSGETQTALNETLMRQMNAAETARNNGYGELLKELGVDLTTPVGVPGNPFRMLAPDDGLGGQSLPSGSGTAGADHELQDPAAKYKGTTDPGHSSSTGSRS